MMKAYSFPSVGDYGLSVRDHGKVGALVGYATARRQPFVITSDGEAVNVMVGDRHEPFEQVTAAAGLRSLP